MSHVSSVVTFDGFTGGGFTVGRKTITLPKKGQRAEEHQAQMQMQHQHMQQQQQQPHQSTHQRGSDGRRKDRMRISLKDKKTVHLHGSAVGGAPVDDESSEGVNLSLADATGQRRRIIEVRQKSARDAQLNARRHAHNIDSQASGFNTAGGNRRAMIVLPKNEEKMRAREVLMQMHPHIGQVFRGLNPPDVFQQEPFDRILQAEAPTAPYRRRNMEIKTTVQWGERKLFLYELEFLTQYGVRPGTVVVYAGVAPGTRIPYLASLFPHIQFVLVDPTPLDFDESTITNVQVRQAAFDDAIAREVKATAAAEGKTILFVANATTDTPNGYIADSGEAEDYVDQRAFTKSSMDDQSRWHGIIQPAKSLLKFSLPWTNDSTYYLDGDILLPVWNAPTSTEMRLIPNTYHRTWSHRHYEEQAFYFNTVTRVSLHEHGVTAEGLDGCYDCTAEVYILERYLERYPDMTPIAVGSQANVIPAASAPAVQLRLDTTRFKDPVWIAKQAEKKKQFLITIQTNENDGQPLTEEQLKAATQQFESQQESAPDVDMGDAAPAAAAADSTAAAAAAAPAADAAPTPSDSMEDAAPAVSLTPLEQLKQNVGKFSQELSHRLVLKGTRTLATLNEKVIKRAAFSKKNRK